MFMFPDSEHFWCCKYWWYSGQRRRQRECHLLSTDASSLWESGPDEWVYKVCHFDNEGCSLWPVCRQQNYKAFSNPNHQNHCAPQRQPSSVELGMFFFFYLFCFLSQITWMDRTWKCIDPTNKFCLCNGSQTYLLPLCNRTLLLLLNY